MAQVSKKCRQYNSEYLRLGLAVMPGTEHVPVCLLCERVFSNGSMKPSRLKRHLIRRHPNMSNGTAPVDQQFWLQKEIPELYPGVWDVVKKLLICLPSTSLVECAFSIVTDLVTQKRSQLQIVRRGHLRLRVTLIEPTSTG
ncbi:zf-BED domain containing protein [Trichuris trichiura]|uniref:Zf-BED domain containing protein n=1 Tax=Trichuris trichiura TaxID=36087 RepID=A0A077ZJK7_TRITR|nr:zf-BED domain containing protein [Trichuris trichiura]